MPRYSGVANFYLMGISDSAFVVLRLALAAIIEMRLDREAGRLIRRGAELAGRGAAFQYDQGASRQDLLLKAICGGSLEPGLKIDLSPLIVANEVNSARCTSARASKRRRGLG